MINQSLFFKTKLVLSFLTLFMFTCTIAQVGINTDTPKSTLDVNLGDISDVNIESPPGITAPSLKLSELNSISNNYTIKQAGVFIYINDIDTNLESVDSSLSNIKSEGYYYFDGFNWIHFVVLDEIKIPTQSWLNSEDGEGASSSFQDIYHDSKVGIGFDAHNNPIDVNAQLEISSTNKGLIIPRLSKDQRDKIVNPTISMLIWNSTEECFNFYKNSIIGWRSMCGESGNAEVNITDCNSITVEGNYTVGVPVDNSNFIKLTVNVVSPGNYNIEATTDIGVFFQKNGFFPTIGSYTIILPAVGTPNTEGNNIPISLSIDNYLTTCNNINIGIISPSNAAYSITQSTSDKLTIGESTNGKTIKLDINVTTAGIFTIETNTIEGVKYGVNDLDLSEGLHTVTLYSNGVIMPLNKADGSKYKATDILNFTISGNGQNEPRDAQVELISNEADFTCTSITVNNVTYVADLAFTSNNYITVKVNVITPGTYTFKATNASTNIEFISTGTFTTTGIKDIQVLASTNNNLPKTNPGNYVFTSTLNDDSNTASTCSFSLDIIYPKPNILVYGWTISNRFRDALKNTSNFGPNGIFKVEQLKDNISIFQERASSLTSAGLMDYINNKNVKIIILTWDVSENISQDVIQVLANFINKRNGTVFFINAQNRGLVVQNIINTTYGLNTEVTSDFYPIRAATLPTFDNDLNNSNKPYMDGVFGKLYDKYYAVDDDESWLGLSPSSFGTQLNFLVDLPEINYNNKVYTAAKTLIYSQTPGFFMLPDAGAYNNVGNNYGENNPIGFNKGNGSNVRILSNTGEIGNGILSIQTVGNWVLFGNIMAEYIKYTYFNYDSSIYINSQAE